MQSVDEALFHGYIKYTGISTSMKVLLDAIEKFIKIDYLYFSFSANNSKEEVNILFDYCPQKEKLNVQKSYSFSAGMRAAFNNATMRIDGHNVIMFQDIKQALSDQPNLLQEYNQFDSVFNSVIVMYLTTPADGFMVRLGIRSIVPRYTLSDVKNLIKFYTPAREVAMSILTSCQGVIQNPVNLNEFIPLSKKNMLTQCHGLAKTMEMADAISQTEANVLILGETGTGKDVLAEAIHEQSAFLAGPFVNVNCSALYDNLLDAELFGYERGSFTGAYSQHKGLFEQASEGTLFLNEIGELSLVAQAKLLTVLESHAVRRIGSQRPVFLRFRLICATNRDLSKMVAEKKFRADLWYRISTIQLELPPLRERREDILTLAEYFCSMYSASLKLSYTPSLPGALKLNLLKAPWYGNVRELRNWVERACICTKLNNSRYLTAPPRQICSLNDEQQSQDASQLDSMEKEYIENCLRRCNGKIQGKNSAAEALGINGSTLRAKMRKLGIPFPLKEKKRLKD